MDPPPKGDALYDALLPYCDPDMEKQIRQMQQTMQQFEQMKDTLEIVQMMKDLFPEGFSGDFADILNF